MAKAGAPVSKGGLPIAAYLGYRAGHEFIWQAMDDPAILAVVRGALAETGRALDG